MDFISIVKNVEATNRPLRTPYQSTYQAPKLKFF